MKRANFAIKACAAALLGLAIAGTAAMAQSQQQPQPMFGPRVGKAPPPAPAEVVGTFGKWKVSCEKVAVEPKEGETEAKMVRSCGIVQATRNEERQNIGLSLVLVKTKQDGKDVVMVRVMAPIGVFLPMGVALEIDGEAISRVPFTRCAPQICMAMGSASDETLTKLKKGKLATFFIYDNPGAGIPMKIDLKGFSDALAALDKENAK